MCRILGVLGELVMIVFAKIVVVSLVLSACARPVFISQELNALKPACTGGYWEICANIGHKVRQAQAEASYLAKAE